MLIIDAVIRPNEKFREWQWQSVSNMRHIQTDRDSLHHQIIHTCFDIIDIRGTALHTVSGLFYFIGNADLTTVAASRLTGSPWWWPWMTTSLLSSQLGTFIVSFLISLCSSCCTSSPGEKNMWIKQNTLYNFCTPTITIDNHSARARNWAAKRNSTVSHGVKGIVHWKIKIHSLSTHHYADGGGGGGGGEGFEFTKHFWSLRGKQCCSRIQCNWSNWLANPQTLRRHHMCSMEEC